MSDKNYAKKTINWGHVSLDIQGTDISLSAGYSFGYPYMRTTILHKLDTLADTQGFLQNFCHSLENDLYDSDKKRFEFLPNWKDENDWRPLERKMKVVFEIRANGSPYIVFEDEYYDSPGFHTKTSLDSILPPERISTFVKEIRQSIQDIKDYEGYHFTEGLN